MTLVQLVKELNDKKLYSLQKFQNSVYYNCEEEYCMNHTYDVVEFAKNIINIAAKDSIYITHLQLQKILYYIQGGYLKKFNREAFSDEILCWEYGPVVKKVWDYFSFFGRSPIMGVSVNEIEFKQEEYQLIYSTILEKSAMNVWDLVEKTHKELPWKDAYEHRKPYIEKLKMREFFCND